MDIYVLTPNLSRHRANKSGRCNTQTWPWGTGFRERSLQIQGTFSAHSANIQCGFREHSVLMAARTGFPRTLPSAVTITVDHPVGSPSLCFPHLPSAVTSTVDHPLGSPSLCFPRLPSAVTSTVDHPLGSSSLYPSGPLFRRHSLSHVQACMISLPLVVINPGPVFLRSLQHFLKSYRE
jgi:hypothetical protein